MTGLNKLFYSTADPTEETGRTEQGVPSDQEQPEEPSEIKKPLADPPKQETPEERVKTAIFFRIWFGLNQKERVKIAIGSLAAAFSGISKPVFGYFIITIAVAYYDSNSKQKVGWYSLFFSAIGLLSLFSHTLQHYFFGVVGEKAMTNLQQALYSGSPFISLPLQNLSVN